MWASPMSGPSATPPASRALPAMILVAGGCCPESGYGSEALRREHASIGHREERRGANVGGVTGFREGSQMAGAADGDPDPVLVRQRPVLRRLPDRAGPQRAYDGRAAGAAGAVRRRRRRTAAAWFRGSHRREGRAQDAPRPAGGAGESKRGPAASV